MGHVGAACSLLSCIANRIRRGGARSSRAAAAAERAARQPAQLVGGEPVQRAVGGRRLRRRLPRHWRVRARLTRCPASMAACCPLRLHQSKDAAAF